MCKCEARICMSFGLTLAGIKPASVAWLGAEEKSKLTPCRRHFAQRGIEFCSLCARHGKTLAMAYDRKALKTALDDGRVRNFLSGYGYDCASVDGALGRLAERMTDGDDFPHEMGVFLGYPIEDVEGYIRTGGRDCALCGFWKVYSDPETKARTFSRYRKCAEAIGVKLKQGLSMAQIFNITI